MREQGLSPLAWRMLPPGADLCPGPQVDQLKLKVSRLEEECLLLRRARGPLPGAEEKEKEPDSTDLVSELRAENQRLAASLQELQEGLQQVWGQCGGGGWAWGSQTSFYSLVLRKPGERGHIPNLRWGRNPGRSLVLSSEQRALCAHSARLGCSV